MMLGCFGHCFFLFLHFMAVLFGFFGLLITIPLHLIFAATLASKK